MAYATTGRDSPPLLFGLAPRGVCRASAVANGAVGSYPTISPLPDVSALVGRARGFPRTCHRGGTHRRSIFCGTVRSRMKCRAKARRYIQPPGVTRRVTLRSPDFPPAQRQPKPPSYQRSSDLPANLNYTRLCHPRREREAMDAHGVMTDVIGMLEYSAPRKVRLDEPNNRRKIGWLQQASELKPCPTCRGAFRRLPRQGS
jgi:hypothetical protein